MKKKNFVNKLHLATKRDYMERMVNRKIECMSIAKKYGRDYWDGNRRYGYGGYRYIKNYWKKTANKIIQTYKLKNSSKILDLGCGKGFLLYEIKKILPLIKIIGLDISKYAIENSKPEIKSYLKHFDIRKKLPFKKKSFDLVITLGTLHNMSINHLFSIIEEINRVGKKSYIMVESYRNDKELFNLQCWALTCESFFSNKEWSWIFKKLNYKGDFEFIHFE